jgi:hypothetical protein
MNQQNQTRIQNSTTNVQWSILSIMHCTSKKQCNLPTPLTSRFRQLPINLTCMKLSMDMEMRNMLNIQMSCGQMILFHNWIFVAAFSHCENCIDYKVKIVNGRTPPKFIFCLSFCKVNHVVYMNYARWKKLLAPSIWQEICCSKWIIAWKTTKIDIC